MKRFNWITTTAAAALLACCGMALAQDKGDMKPDAQPGKEAPTAWLVDTALTQQLLGAPRVPLARMIDWVADWARRDMPSLGKETHFSTRDGKY